jgi:hypothetical protein
MSLIEAAQKLEISWERAWRLVLQGKLRGEKRAGRWVVGRGSVMTFLARRNIKKLGEE